MPEGNPLVAESKKDGDGPGPLTAGNGDYGYAGGIGLAESAMDTFNGIKDGDWISGGLGALSLVGEVAGAAVDPFGYLMSSVASFLMEHIQPLKDMLDAVAGDPPVIQSYADTWGNVSKALGERKTDLDNAVKTGTTGWSGQAADAYRKQAAEHGEALSSAATVAGGISTAVMVFGQIVSFVRETVRQLIADLVGKLISWVMEEVFSLGFGTPVVVAQASAAIAKWGKKIGDLLKKLTDSIRKISPLLSKLVDVFEKIAKIFGKVLGKVSGLDGLKIDHVGFKRHIPKESGVGGGHHGGGSHGGDGEGGSHGGDGDSSPDGGSSHGGEGDSSPGGSDSPSSDPARTDGSSPGSDSGSRRTSGRDDASPRGEDGAPTHSGDSTPSSQPDNLTSSPSARTGDGGSPSHRGGGESNPPAHAGDSSPSPTHAGDSSPSPARHASDSSPAPTHAGDSTPSPARGAGDSSPSPTRHAGDSSPAPTHAGDSSPSPTHAGDSTPPARSAAPSHTDTGGAPTHSSLGRADAPSTHGGGETPSSAASPRTGDATTASGSAAPATPRTGEPGTSGVPSPRGGDGVSQPGVPPQGGMMGGGTQPGGAPGAGGMGGSSGRTGGGGWTGTPGSSGSHTPHTPEPSARPRGGGEPRPRTPEPAARGGYGPGTTTPTHGPGTHPSGNGPGGRPGHTGPGSAHGPSDGTPHHSPDDGTHGTRDHDGTPDHDPGDTPPHHEPLSPDEVNARHAEDTPAGSSYHGGDPEMGDLPHRVLPDPDGRYTVDVHVTKDGYARIGDRLYTPEEFADILRRNGTYDGRPIRLIGCDAGSNDFAHRLSRELDTEVMAPTKPAWTDSHGRVFSSDYEIGPDGKMRPRIPPDGEWNTHHPDGSTHRASDDGFTPDTPESGKHDLDADDAVSRGKQFPSPRDIEGGWKEPHYGREEPVSLHPNERFYDPQNPRHLEPDTKYEVTDADGRRSTIYTNNEQPPRITHIDADVPNTRVGADPHTVPGNPDASHLLPDVAYRVDTGDGRFEFPTDADGHPKLDLDNFDPPADATPHRIDDYDPGREGNGPFSATPREKLEPNTRYEIHGKDGQWHGTFYTNGETPPQFTHIRTWHDVDRGMINPETGDIRTMHDPVKGQYEGLPLPGVKYEIDYAKAGTELNFHADAHHNGSVSAEPDYTRPKEARVDVSVQQDLGHKGQVDHPGAGVDRGGHTLDSRGGGLQGRLGISPQAHDQNHSVRGNPDTFRQSEIDRQTFEQAGGDHGPMRVYLDPASRGQTADRWHVMSERIHPDGSRTYNYRSFRNVPNPAPLPAV